jgi:OmpA-OmpF porin, OOP family
MRARHAWAAVVACAALLAARGNDVVRAGEIGDIALDQLEPAPAGDAFFSVPSPMIGGHLVPRAYVLVNHAGQPLVLSTDAESGAVVANQTWLHVSASLALWSRLLVGVMLPVVLAQSGESPVIQGVPIASPSSAEVGDLRFSLRVRFFGEDVDPLQVSAGVYLHVPTGPTGTFAGEGYVRAAPHLLFGGQFSRFVWSASAGVAVRGSETPPTVVYSAGFGVRLWDERLQIGPEIFAATPFYQGRVRVERVRLNAIERVSTTNLEVLLGARARLPFGFVVGAGGGVGLTDAIGTPAFRVVGSVGWELPPPKLDAKTSDADEDTIADTADACPYAFGPASPDPKRNGCPVVDSDEDGVPDADDACPTVAGDPKPGANVKGSGCPEAPEGAPPQGAPPG